MQTKSEFACIHSLFSDVPKKNGRQGKRLKKFSFIVQTWVRAETAAGERHEDPLKCLFPTSLQVKKSHKPLAERKQI